MRGPPDPKTRSPAAANGRAKSLDNHHAADTTETVRAFQAASLRRLYSFCQATVCTIARLAYAVGAP